MFRIHTGRIAAIALLLSTAALPQTGLAQSYLDTVPKGAKTVYTASLADMTNANHGMSTTRTLDWRQPSIELYFDLPPAERTSDIVLTLSADPLSRVAPNAPLQVQFNGGKPVPVLSNGRGFEARLPFDANIARDHHNTIRISYPIPVGADCVSPIHGAWSIDLADSTLRMAGRALTRNMRLSEVTEFLQQPAFTPKTVGLIARGPNGTDMQALAAQGIALRTPDVPKFSVLERGSDFNVIMAKRNRLFDITNDPKILNTDGPRIFVTRDRPAKLIFTADTDAEILYMLESFATRALPRSRGSISSLGELNLQNYLASRTVKAEGKMPLWELEAGSDSNFSGTQTYKFGVTDPGATRGEVLLRLSTTKDLEDSSRLEVTLNGKSLGATKLDKKRKSVAFDIDPGALNATSNILTLTPDLAASSDFSCEADRRSHAGFSIGEGSRLELKETVSSPVTELSQLAATGGLFAQTESYIVLPRQTRDYQAALSVLGRLAKSTGHGLTLADYSRDPDVARDKNVLLIGPPDMVKDHLTGAPKALREALSGQSSSGDNLLQASFGQSASIGDDEDDAALKYAAAQSGPRKISGGGVAALFGAGDGTLTGVITATPRSSFSRNSQTLIESAHWNAMRGGVVRWTASSMVTAQIAQSDAGIVKPKSKSGLQLPDLGWSGIEDLQWPDINFPEIQWPDLEWPDVNWPEFDVPQVSLPDLKWPNLKSATADVPEEPEIMTREVSVPRSPTAELGNLGQPEKTLTPPGITPRLKPALKDPAKPSVGLRGPFEFSLEGPKKTESFQDLKRVTKDKWSATKNWFKAKTESLSEIRPFEEAARATDRLQDKVKPSGRTLKTTLKDKIPGKGLVQLGDRTFSVYGLLLMLAFGLVLLLMSLAKPTSRLGGRH